MIKVAYYFKIAAEANLAETKDGEPAPAYTELSLGERDTPLTQEEHERHLPGAVSAIAATLGIAEEHLTPISEAEYLEKTGEG